MNHCHMARIDIVQEKSKRLRQPLDRMKWFRVDSFSEAWRPVYRLSRLLSFTTMTYNFRDQTASRTSADQTMLVLGVLVGVVGMYYTFTFYQARIFAITNSHIISAGRFMNVVVVIIVHIATMILNYVNGAKIAQFPRNVQNIDRQISFHFKHSWNYQVEHLRSILFIVIRFVEWIVIIQIMKYTSDPFETADLMHGFFMLATFNWINFGYQANVVNWVVTLATIRKRLSVLNHYMRDSLLDVSTSQEDPQQLRKLILKIGILHNQLSDAVDHFNNCHSTTIMFSFAPAFMFTMFSWFGLIHAYAANVERLIPNAWATASLSLNYITFMFYDVLFSVLVNDQVKQTAVIVHKCIGYRPYHKDVCHPLRKISQQLWHHSPVISCGLFSFDWELLYTMIASLSTYLVILVQFDLVNYAQSASTSTQH